MINIEIVKIKEAHIDDIMIIENLSFSIPWSRNAFVEEITKNKFARYICARIDQRIVGYAGLWKVFEEGHITNIAVHPEFRGNGIGSDLMEGIIALAKAEDITSLTLEVRRGNVEAQALYNKFGFSSVGFRKGYYSDNGEDALIMWKEGI